jgi:gas vesicle protein
MKNEEGGNGVKSFILTFLIGGLAGAGAALLFAPKIGRETRQTIKDAAGNVKEKTGECVEQVKTNIISAVEKGKGLFQEKKAIFATAIEAGKEAYEKEKERLVKGDS